MATETIERCCATSHVRDGVPYDRACSGFELGANGRCVLCDHEESCHAAAPADASLPEGRPLAHDEEPAKAAPSDSLRAPTPAQLHQGREARRSANARLKDRGPMISVPKRAYLQLVRDGAEAARTALSLSEKNAELNRQNATLLRVIGALGEAYADALAAVRGEELEDGNGVTIGVPYALIAIERQVKMEIEKRGEPDAVLRILIARTADLKRMAEEAASAAETEPAPPEPEETEPVDAPEPSEPA